MSNYQFAGHDGNIEVVSYDERSNITQTQIQNIFQNTFDMFPIPATIEQIGVDDVFKVKFEGEDSIPDVYICSKSTTPGGRSSLSDEHRIQPRAKSINYICEKGDEGNKAVLIGIYNWDDVMVFCTWAPSRSGAASENTPISKQVKITTIAKAIKEGFAQQEKGNGEYVCAFKPEFLYFYLRNSEWLHNSDESDYTEKADKVCEGEDETTVNDDVIDSGSLFYTGYDNLKNKHYNLIVFGAPGTGKSYYVNSEKDDLIGKDNESDYERVTFHPDYAYANFVGTYKPVPSEDGKSVTYKYVPGPFMRIYTKALKNSREKIKKPFILIIEEINRANVAAVFGDVFQLLDREERGVSEYPVKTSEDVKRFLADELGGNPNDYSEIRLPNNLFIWATMNSADQGVFPMDTAFKRRWDFEYIGIDDNETDIKDKFVLVGNDDKRIEWNSLRHEINRFMSEHKINEDKLIGPYFIPRRITVPSSGDIDKEEFAEIFKNKVLMYLYEDGCRSKRDDLFLGALNKKERKTLRYSEICDAFDEYGYGIFNISIEKEIKVVRNEESAEIE